MLDGIMREPSCNPFARIAAAQALLDRGWGKPITEHRGDALAVMAVQINQIRHEIIDATDQPRLLEASQVLPSDHNGET